MADGPRTRLAPAGTAWPEDLRRSPSAVRDRAGNLASDVGESAQQAWDSTRRGVARAAGQIGGTAGDAWAGLTGAMRRYPFATLAVGFSLGVLVTLAMDRGRRF